MNKISLIFQQLSPEKTDTSKARRLSSRSARKRSRGSGHESRSPAAPEPWLPGLPLQVSGRRPRQATPRREQQRRASRLSSFAAGRESQSWHAPSARRLSHYTH